MPYIDQRARLALQEREPMTPGELNYKITVEVLNYLNNNTETDTLTYRDYNEVIGVLECVKQELYRRMLSPYEDQMIGRNGDVYNGGT